MIVIIDDEKWIINPIIDFFNDKARRINERYCIKHFYRAVEAISFINENVYRIDLIIVDVAMDYGDGDVNKEISGGAQLISELKACNLTKDIPIIIYSIHKLDYFKDDLQQNPIDEKSIYYINRDEDANNNLLYPLVDKIIKNK
jgi:hypothetical protein